MTEPAGLWRRQLELLVDNALAEDLGWGDVTTRALIPPEIKGKAVLVMKREGVIAGIQVAALVFQRVDPELKFTSLLSDGAGVKPGDVAATVEGPIASILKGERVALNFLQRLSGIATGTAQYVGMVSGTNALVVDTRKTTPGLRALEKYAVRVGGGHNHRQNLSDGILIKDNHLAALSGHGVSLQEAIKMARRKSPHTLRVEVEVESVDKVKEALAAGADIIMLDNMKIEDMREAVKLVRGRALLEASGGITLENVRAVAEAGVDLISIGAITHSAKALDISLELEHQH